MNVFTMNGPTASHGPIACVCHGGAGECPTCAPRPVRIAVMTRPCDHHPNLLRAVGLCHLIGAKRW